MTKYYLSEWEQSILSKNMFDMLVYTYPDFDNQDNNYIMEIDTQPNSIHFWSEDWEFSTKIKEEFHSIYTVSSNVEENMKNINEYFKKLDMIEVFR